MRHNAYIRVRGLLKGTDSLFHLVGPRDQTQVIWFGGKYFYVASHLACPFQVFSSIVKWDLLAEHSGTCLWYQHLVDWGRRVTMCCKPAWAGWQSFSSKNDFSISSDCLLLIYRNAIVIYWLFVSCILTEFISCKHFLSLNQYVNDTSVLPLHHLTIHSSCL